MRAGSMSLLLVLLLLAPSSAEDGSSARWGLDQIQDQIDALSARIRELARDAQKDPRRLLLEQYKAFTADDWNDKKREPRVKQMIEWVFEPECNMVLRQETAGAIIAARMWDPDLDGDAKRGQSLRARFCEREMVPHLTDKEASNRKFADALLKGFWGDNPREPDARAYSWNEANKRTWRPAQKAWKKLLDDR